MPDGLICNILGHADSFCGKFRIVGGTQCFHLDSSAAIAGYDAQYRAHNHSE
jgi:hypothetical protein